MSEKIFSEKSNVDLGVNITGELEGLKKNLDAYKVKIILHMCHFRYSIIFGSKK